MHFSGSWTMRSAANQKSAHFRMPPLPCLTYLHENVTRTGSNCLTRRRENYFEVYVKCFAGIEYFTVDRCVQRYVLVSNAKMNNLFFTTVPSSLRNCSILAHLRTLLRWCRLRLHEQKLQRLHILRKDSSFAFRVTYETVFQKKKELN